MSIEYIGSYKAHPVGCKEGSAYFNKITGTMFVLVNHDQWLELPKSPLSDLMGADSIISNEQIREETIRAVINEINGVSV